MVLERGGREGEKRWKVMGRGERGGEKRKKGEEKRGKVCSKKVPKPHTQQASICNLIVRKCHEVQPMVKYKTLHYNNIYNKNVPNKIIVEHITE